MHTQRFDIYRLIHKGLRAYLSDTLLAVGRMDLESTPDVHSGLDALNGLLDFCESHLRHENAFIHPAMERAEPGSAEAMNHHHQHHEALIAELRAIVHQLRHAEASAREARAAQLYRTLALFVADNMAHMHEEETRNNELLWRAYSDEQIMLIHDAILRSIPDAEHQVAMRWMLAAFNHQERQRMLQEIQRSAPQQVFDGTLELARCTLPGNDWNKLQTAIGC